MLEIIVVTILIATVLNIILHKINIPTIIGYILTGILIDQIFGLHQAVRSHELKTLAEFGVVFLMFTIGLEFSVRHLMRLKKDVFWYGGLQVTISAVFIGLIGYNFFDLDVKTSILFGGALAVSSTAIVLKMLKENGEISRRYGRKAVGILLFQDIAVIPMLLMITIFSTNNLDVSDLLIDTFTKAFILFAIMIVVGKYILEYFLEKVVSTESDEILIGSILLIVIGSSSLAHGLGFSYSLGAFMAGMMIAETHYRHRVEEEFTHFRDMLLGVFFITVGMQVDFGVIFSNVEAIVT
ncbi:MAG: cation:proton antiporter, partial [Campylobacterales bacterium]|nr:cation:proton antiporter [Campylobacterales bacterium]